MIYLCLQPLLTYCTNILKFSPNTILAQKFLQKPHTPAIKSVEQLNLSWKGLSACFCLDPLSPTPVDKTGLTLVHTTKRSERERVRESERLHLLGCIVVAFNAADGLVYQEKSERRLERL